MGVEKVEGDNNGHRYSGLVYAALNTDGNRVGTPLKSSLFGKSYGIEALERLMTKSGEALKTKGLPANPRTTITASLANSNTGGEFRTQLREKGIDLVLRYGNSGRLFGTTLIDHNSRTVLNGSALGKDFAANALAERFPDLATENRENKRLFLALPMVDEDVVRAAQRTSSNERDRTTTTLAPSAERTHDMPIASPTPTNKALRQTLWPTQGNREMVIARESDGNDQNPDNHLTLPDLSSIGDAAGSLFSILTPDPGGQTDNRYVRRIKPPKKKRGQSV